MPDNLLNTEQVADLAGLSPRTIKQMRQTGNGPRYFRLGERTIRYKREDINEWIEKKYQETATTGAA